MGTLFPSITPFIEILIIAVMINYLMSFFWNTRSMDLVLGMLAFLLIFAISSWLNLPILHKIMLLIGNVAVIAILIIFQPELRVALSKLSVKGKRYKGHTEFDKFLDQLANSTYRLSERRVGALIVLEHEDLLSDLANKSVVLNANFSSELLESVFMTTTPLHDGAIIIRGQTILAAAVILPLADESTEITRSMGTRHRAALGVSQISDALVIVISEETGRVSISRDGVMTPGVKIDRLKGIIRSLFAPAPQSEFSRQFNLREWVRR